MELDEAEAQVSGSNEAQAQAGQGQHDPDEHKENLAANKRRWPKRLSTLQSGKG